MPSVRRLYLYVIAFIAFGSLLFGLANLIRLLLEAATGGVGEYLFITGEDLLRRQTALFVATVVVALPIWLLHWIPAERSARQSGPAGDAERLARSRRIALALALGCYALLPTATALWRLLAGLLGRTLGARAPAALPGPIGTLLICGAAALLIWRTGERDLARTPALAARDGWRRFVVFAAVAAGVALTGFGLTALAGLLVDLLAGRGETLLAADLPHWWAGPMAANVASLLTGAALWVVCGGGMTRLAAGTTPRAVAERRSTVRRIAWLAVLLGAILATLIDLARALEQGVRLLLGGADHLGGPDGIGARAAEALLAALVAGVIWWAAARRLTADVRLIAETGADPSTLGDLRRTPRYVTALAALAVLTGGAVMLVNRLADWLVGRGQPLLSATPGAGRWVAPALATLLVGVAVWAPVWRDIQQAAAADPAARRSPVRRAALALATGVGALILLGSLSVALSAIVGALLGTNDDPARRLAGTAGWLLGGGFLAAYHGALYRADAALPAPPVGAAAELPAALRLTLALPPGADPDAALAALRAALPPGSALHVDRAADA
ncbi:MAG: hypothetical protein IT337_03715 [Thermomicrobiales bacterium]|nr:hypothetical protein [Thermomicrobiales bacterium]